MEPLTSARAQALRCLAISEKFLSGRDLVGSKTFAIRARESDPTLEEADQILAVTDTLIAAEKRIPGSNYQDWYALLQLSRPTNDLELINSRYCRLALLLNPQKNMLPFGEQAFRLVMDAGSILSDPSKKAFYDAHINFYSQLEAAPVDSTACVNHDSQSYLWPPQQQSLPHQLQHQRQQQQQEQPQLELRQQYKLHQHHQQQHQQQQEQQRWQQPHLVEERQQQQLFMQHEQQEHGTMQSSQKGYNDVTNNASAAAISQERNNVRKESAAQPTVEGPSSSFWTACPYCYHIYEYPKFYAECALRCQTRDKAFEAVAIPQPQLADGKEAYYFCWAYFPIGISPSDFEKKMGMASSWSPFSMMVACSGMNYGYGAPLGKKTKSSTPRVYYDDDDIFVELSDSSSDSDDDDVDWRNIRRKKKRKSVKYNKGKGTHYKVVRPQVELESNASVSNGGNLNLQERVTAEPKRKVASNNAKKPTRKTAKEWERLDLNVEFNNEVEEPTRKVTEGGHAVGHAVGHGLDGEDNIEGIGFFEGLDEFLNSLPILSNVKDDKVKAT